MLYAVLTFLIVVMAAGMVAMVMANQRAEKRNRVLNVVKGGSAADDKKKSRISEQDQRRADLAKKLKESGDGEEKKANSLPDMIMQAGFETSVKKFWIYSIVFAVLMTFLAKVMGFSLFVTIMVAITSFFGLPRLFLKFKAKRRQKKFMDDFADALESMMRLLKAGMPVSEAIKMVAREFSGPVGEEMSRIFDQQKIGVPLPEAVLESARRMPLAEMQMFATAIAIQTQTGSSLSEVLENLAGVIRARFRLKRKVDALSSEAKASAMIIGALPCLVGGGMYLINREYIEVLFIDPTGKFLLGAAITWMFMGVIVMRQMINFKV